MYKFQNNSDANRAPVLHIIYLAFTTNVEYLQNITSS